MPDYTEHMTEPTVAQFQRLTALVAELHKEETEVARLAEELKKAQGRARDVGERRLPEVMDEMGLSEFKTTTGLVVKLKETIHASIPKTRHSEAMDWLDEHDLSGLVKREFVIRFGREDDSWANQFEGQMKRRKRQLNVNRQRRVEPATLKKFVSDQLKDGIDIPLELFGVFKRRTVQVSS